MKIQKGGNVLMLVVSDEILTITVNNSEIDLEVHDVDKLIKTITDYKKQSVI